VIVGRIAAVRERMARAAERAGRSIDAITLVAVSKTHPPGALREAYAAGIRDFGENRIQEAEGKIPALGDLEGVRWHLVGHLQSNKASRAVDLFDRIHSLDTPELGLRLEHVASQKGKVMRALLQVDLAGEVSKSGLKEVELVPALERLRGHPSLQIEGLMVLPPYDEDPERVRPYFRRLRELRDRAWESGLLAGGDLSMGMSHDLETAVEEGATLVRVGTAIFGERRGA